MMVSLSTHPTADKLTAFLHGRLPAEEQGQIEEHIAACVTCCAVLVSVPEDTLLQNLRTGDTPPPPANLPPPLSVPPELVNHPRYRLQKFLGKGGMGMVFQAEHRLMERPVALKILHPEWLRDLSAVERFRLEFKAAARLSHPNIVGAYDAEQAGNLHFLVMEYVEGINLHRYVERDGPVSVSHACLFIRQAALGLQHAHEHGMVHRDIKPQNLMLTRKGKIKILDFGLARLAREVGSRGAATAELPETISGITHQGLLLGTPDFIAPEQIDNPGSVDIRADIYSLGCTFFFLLNGEVPFPGGSKTRKLEGHSQETLPPLVDKLEGVPQPVKDILERMVAKDPAERFQTPAEVAQALVPFCKTSESAQPRVVPNVRLLPPPTKPRGLRWKPVAITAGAVLGGALTIVLVVTALGDREPVKDKQAVPVTTAENQNQQTGAKITPASFPSPGSARVLMVVPHRAFWYPDYGPVRQHLEKGGAKVTVASSSMEPATPHNRGKSDQPVQPDLLIKDVRADDFDAIYFSGGMVLEYTGDRPEARVARKLIGEMLDQKKYVSAMCSGVIVLADAGCLKGIRAARSTHILNKVREEDAKWDNKSHVVESGSIITGGDFERAAEPLANALLKALGKLP